MVIWTSLEPRNDYRQIMEKDVRQLKTNQVGKLTIFLLSVILTTFAHAGTSKTFGDWYTGTSADGSYLSALTMNLNGDALAEFCYMDKHCEWRYSTADFRCTPGEKGVILLNASTGSDSITTECLGELVKGSWTSRLAQWSVFESVANNNPEIGLAIASQGTGFRVIRFSLRGMNAATASIGGAINPSGPNARPPSTVRDEVL